MTQSFSPEPEPYSDYLEEPREILREMLESKTASEAAADAANEAADDAVDSVAAAAGSAAEAEAYAREAGAVFAQAGPACFAVNEDTSVTVIFTKED